MTTFLFCCRSSLLVPRRLLPALLGALIVLTVQLSSASAQTVAAAYAADYTVTNLGSVSGLPGPYGGLTFVPGNPNELLIGGNADAASGAIYEVPVVRGPGQQITGFGSATLYATAPYIDGGLAFGPGGVLFFTGYPTNTLGEIEPGSTSANLTINLSSLGIASSGNSTSVGALQFDPNGNFKIVSYGTGAWYTASLAVNGSGTYNLTNVTNVPTANEGSKLGPEGIGYVPPGSPLFTAPSLLIAQNDTLGPGYVTAYTLDANNNPIVTTGQTFVTGLTYAEGGTIDPLTGDFFATYGAASNQVVEVSGFAAPVPEPSTLVLLSAGAIGLVTFGLKRRATRKTAKPAACD